MFNKKAAAQYDQFGLPQVPRQGMIPRTPAVGASCPGGAWRGTSHRYEVNHST